jgi:lysozyme family protein
MSDNRQLEQGHDWTQRGEVITGKGDAIATFRGIQADLNFFVDKVGFEPLKPDGVLGPKTLAAIQAVDAAVTKANPMLAGMLAPQTSVVDVATHAVTTRAWLEATARSALAVGNLRRYHRGAGKEWNVNDSIAYGAGPVHDEFRGLQADLNQFADTVGFKPLEPDGFLGPRTAAAVKAVYDAVVAGNPMLAMTPFPAPDTKEEAAEFCMFIRQWIEDVASKHVGRAEA